MVVGVLTTSYPRGPGDFRGAFVADRVRALRARGHVVEVIAGGPGAPEVDDVTVTRLPAHVGAGPDLFAGAGAPEALEGGGAATLMGAARFSSALVAAVAGRARRWDRMESHWLAPCALAGVAAAPALAHRAHAHSGDVSLLERIPFGRSLARVLVRSGIELVFASDDLRARFGRLAGQTRGTVEPLAVPEALFSAGGAGPAAADRAGLAVGAPTVISVGRLVPIKGYDLLVRACAPTRAGERPLDVVILGDGPERDRLVALAQRLDVPLRLPGVRPREEVARWLRSADLYAQPSRVLSNGRCEGLPTATREALAMGLPVVAADSGGLVELAARDPSVRLFPSGDARALAAALREGLTGICGPNVARV